VALTERLSTALEADIAALEQGRPREMRSPGDEVQQLTALYGREAAHFSPSAVTALPREDREILLSTTARFKELLSRHARMLTRVKTATEGMIKAIADDVARRNAAQRPYAPTSGARAQTGALLFNSVI
jgi:hypothetical protein